MDLGNHSGRISGVSVQEAAFREGENRSGDKDDPGWWEGIYRIIKHVDMGVIVVPGVEWQLGMM